MKKIMVQVSRIETQTYYVEMEVPDGYDTAEHKEELEGEMYEIIGNGESHEDVIEAEDGSYTVLSVRESNAALNTEYEIDEVTVQE